MPLDTFRKLEPNLKRTRLVYLQGWGEPFLNQDIFKMIKIAKNAGCLTGTTTNGILIDQDMIEKIIESELDLIAFSVAGLDKTNDTIRRGTNFNNIMESIEIINDIKQKRGLNRPSIHIAYLLLRSGINDVKNMLERFKNRGINQIVITTLDFIAAERLKSELIFPSNEIEYRQIADILDGVVEDGKKHDLEIRYYLGSMAKSYTSCTENIQRAAFISADGLVSPCVFLNMPVSELHYWRNDDKRKSGRLTFGNINEELLASIWRKRDYVKFRQSFGSTNIYPACHDCPKYHMEAK